MVAKSIVFCLYRTFKFGLLRLRIYWKCSNLT